MDVPRRGRGELGGKTTLFPPSTGSRGRQPDHPFHTSEDAALADKKAFPLRISAEVLDATQRWAEDELRSLNAQIEYVLREALRKAGRFKVQDSPPNPSQEQT
jgi:hypothetical protein